MPEPEFFLPEPEFFLPEPEPEVKNPEFAQHYMLMLPKWVESLSHVKCSFASAITILALNMLNELGSFPVPGHRVITVPFPLNTNESV